MLSFGAIIYFMLSFNVIIFWCYHLMLSFGVIIWCYHLFYVIIWCYHFSQFANVIIFVLSFFLVQDECYHLCYHLMLSFFCYHFPPFFFFLKTWHTRSGSISASKWCGSATLVLAQISPGFFWIFRGTPLPKPRIF